MIILLKKEEKRWKKLIKLFVFMFVVLLLTNILMVNAKKIEIKEEDNPAAVIGPRRCIYCGVLKLENNAINDIEEVLIIYE